MNQSNPKKKVALISLGCARNLVDSQMILGRFQEQGYQLVDLKEADIAVLNTCSFVEDARKESIDAVLDLLKLKAEGKISKVIVAGCLPQRYKEDLVDEFEEVDAFLGVQSLSPRNFRQQVALTPDHFAYVKICESCFNQCSFCAIPHIKGRFQSREMDSILEEVSGLEKRGVKEINIIGQDITAYGLDIYKKKSLAELLEKITKEIRNIQWVRLLYTFPTHITDELIDAIAKQEKICKYIDIPLQHINNRILKAMGRNMTKEETMRLIRKIRDRIPEVILRSTFIVGFPGETEEEFDELRKFVSEAALERVGVFTYSREEGTSAYDFQGQVSEEAKAKRKDALMKEQQKSAAAFQKSLLGRKMKVLIDEKEGKTDNEYIGRTEYDAPDVDGCVYVRSARKLNLGDFVEVKITDAYEYDLVGEVV